MATRRRRSRAGREPLTRERILQAAFELADADGLGALTMHNIGRRLGVQAMSLYRHVQNKDDILDGLVDLVMSEIALPSGLGWRASLRARTIAARQAFRRHRWAIGLVESRTRPGPATVAHHEWVLKVLLDAGFSGLMAGHAYNLVDAYIEGFTLQEARMPFDTQEEMVVVVEGLIEQLPVAEFPSMVRVAKEFLSSGSDYEDEFEFGLDLILDGIERAKAQG